MTLFVDVTVAGHGDVVRHTVPGGGWVVTTHPDPEAVCSAVDGTGPGSAAVLVGDANVGSLDPARRQSAGLAVVPSRVGPVPGMRVADLLLLNLRGPRAGVVASLVGRGRAAGRLADDQAAVRAMAGRLGVVRWLDAPLEGLRPDIEALVDLMRGLASTPEAVVWRCPEWLRTSAVADLAGVLAEEQQRVGFAVLELRADEVG